MTSKIVDHWRLERLLHLLPATVVLLMGIISYVLLSPASRVWRLVMPG